MYTNPKSNISNFALPNIINFACCNTHIVAINNHYDAFFWRKCSYSDHMILTFKKISVDNVVSVSCANYYTLLLTKSGILYEIGNNDTLISKCEITYNLSSYIPKKLDINGILSIKSGEYHVVVATTRGIYTWGSNKSGQTGFGTYSKKPQLIKYDYF
jgi:alpha-tubulin suppressor-like RCC1 family protein